MRVSRLTMPTTDLAAGMLMTLSFGPRDFKTESALRKPVSQCILTAKKPTPILISIKFGVAQIQASTAPTTVVAGLPIRPADLSCNAKGTTFVTETLGSKNWS